MAPVFEQAVHSLRGLPHVIDVRNYGLVAGIEVTRSQDHPARAPSASISSASSAAC
jgi:beta-alanine--pyruvate transaminase